MASLTTLVGGLQTALTTTTTSTPALFTTTTCFYAFDPRKSLSYPPADQFCVIQPNRLGVPDRVFRGGGNIGSLISLEVTIWLYVRLALDEYNRADVYLTNQTLGSLAITDSVIELFQNYTILDGDNGFGYELDDIEWQNEEREGTGWGVTKLKYHTDLTGRS